MAVLIHALLVATFVTIVGTLYGLAISFLLQRLFL